MPLSRLTPMAWIRAARRAELSRYDPAVPRVVLDRVREVIPEVPLDIIRDARHFSPETPERIAGILTRVLRSQQ
jgi:nitrogen-specific signal transduction histidine kinase